MLELDEKHAHADGDSCGLILHGLMVVQGVVEHVNSLCLYVAAVSSRVTAVCKVQRLPLKVVKK